MFKCFTFANGYSGKWDWALINNEEKVEANSLTHGNWQVVILIPGTLTIHVVDTQNDWLLWSSHSSESKSIKR